MSNPAKKSSDRVAKRLAADADSPTPTFSRPASVTETVSNYIRSQIASSTIQPGERLPSEPRLATTLSVGRSTVREAIQALEFAGLVRTAQGAGTFVTDNAMNLIRPYTWAASPTPETREQLRETRLILETALASFAAERATPEDLDRIRTAEGSHEACTDLGVETGYSFHLSIAAAAHNEVLLHTYQSTSDIYHEVYAANISSEDFAAEHRRTIRQHRAILDAVEAGDAKKASAAMTRHLKDVM